MKGWGAMEAKRMEGWGAVCGLSSLSLQEPGRGAVSYQTLEPSPGPDMKRSWQIFVLWVFWVFILWLMVPCLDPKHEWAPQEKWINMVPWRCCCPWFKFRISGYPSRTLNYSLCHDTVRRDQFDAGNQKMKGYLMGAAESTSPNAVLWWLVSDQHRVIPPHPSQAQPTSTFQLKPLPLALA